MLVASLSSRNLVVPEHDSHKADRRWNENHSSTFSPSPATGVSPARHMHFGSHSPPPLLCHPRARTRGLAAVVAPGSGAAAVPRTWVRPCKAPLAPSATAPTRRREERRRVPAAARG